MELDWPRGFLSSWGEGQEDFLQGWIQQALHRQLIIHLLATPLRYRSFGRDVDARFSMGGVDHAGIPKINYYNIIQY